MIHVGIDNGLTGAAAVLYPSGSVEFFDTPTVKTGTKGRQEYDLFGVIELLRKLSAAHTPRTLMLTIEKAHVVPKMGGMSNFSKGFGYAAWLTAAIALGLPIQVTASKTWQAVVMRDLPKVTDYAARKEQSRLKARQLYPQAADQLARKKDHGRAEALLIAHYSKTH